MSGIEWRWNERDFGFRFSTKDRKRLSEFYQAKNAGEFYTIPPSQRKLTATRIAELAALTTVPSSRTVVTNPWQHYDRDFDWIETDDGTCFNFAGCLDNDEVARREDEGVQRAMELVTETVECVDPVPLTVHLLSQLHSRLLGTIYPFAGQWRTVALHKGTGPTKWPLPPAGIQPLMDVLERDVLSRSPIVSDDDEDVFLFASEVMNEILAIHPFREGNGRIAFIIGNLILMQNNMLPLTTYERRTYEEAYFAACEAGRINKDYKPLARLLSEWEDIGLERWRDAHG